MKESDLALRIINHFESLGYESYKEVCAKGRGGDARCDVYFVKREGDKIVNTIAVETKLNMNLKVIEQADKWIKYSNKTYVCVPSAKRANFKGRRFAYKVCKSMGIGVIECSPYDTKEKVASPIREKFELPPLYEQQKDFVAGTDDSKYYTSFKHTVKQLEDFMEDKTEYRWTDLIKEIKHHYRTDNNAKSALRKFVGGKVIPGYYMDKRGRDLYLVKGSSFKK